MEESISSSRTIRFYDGNSYCSHHHHQQQSPAAVAALAATSDFEDADDSGWTAYFLQLASDEEEDASNREKQQQQLPDIGGVPCESGSGRGSASTASKPNKAKDNKQAVKTKVLKKTKEALHVHVVGTTRIIEEKEEEEDPLQDTASSPLLQLNINRGLQQEVCSTPDYHK